MRFAANRGTARKIFDSKPKALSTVIPERISALKYGGSKKPPALFRRGPYKVRGAPPTTSDMGLECTEN
jgi:hypothetical protein